MADDIKKLVAITALNNMMSKGHFSICTIDSVATMLDINPKNEAYRILNPLHCINFADMPKEIRGAVPSLIQECLGVEPNYKFNSIGSLVQTIDIEQEKPRKGILSFLGKAQ
jgi:hypothetical protein